MATEQVKVVRIDTDPAQKSVKDLRNELKQLKDTMLSTEKGTEEYNNAMQQAAEIQHTLKEQMEEVNASAMDFGQIVSNCTKAVGGLVGGFQAATAVMNLFGVENEDVIKTLKTMQQMMAITQALPAIDNGVKAFKRLALAIQSSSTALQGLSKAMIATGLGVIAAALGLLIANWDKVSDAMKRWGIINEDTKKKLEEQKKKVEDLRGELAKLERNYEEFEKNEKISKLNSKAKESYESLGKEISRYQQQLQILVTKQQLPENQSRKNWEALQAEGIQLQNQISLLKNQQAAILASADSYKEIIKETGKHTGVLEKDNEWLREQTDMFKKLREEMERYRQELEELDESEDEDTSTEDAYRKSVEDTVESLRKSFETVEEQYKREQNALDVALKTKLISQEEYNKLSEALAKEHADAMQKQAVQEAQIWMSALGQLGSVFSSIADTIDRSTEEGEEKYKALMYTSTIVSMLAGIGGAIASAFMPVNSYMTIWGQIALAATASASVLASGIAQLVQIKNANSNSTLGGGSAYSSPSTQAITNMIAPVQYTQDVQGATIEGAIRDSKVYVTETDITKTQNKVKVSETEARF